MQSTEVQLALAAAVEEVLETMCFICVLSSSEEAMQEAANCDSFVAVLHFEGNVSGEFRLKVPVKLAQVVGSGFLGKEEAEISHSQAGEVVCELANMFCGSALSRLEGNTIFHLSHPEIASPQSMTPVNGCGISRWFELENGILAASLNFQQAS